MPYRPDIDGLRAVAVVSVVLFHAFPTALPSGFIGVDVFFVISGYLISGHIFQNLESGRFSILGFYKRRSRRIFPALIVLLFTCLSFGWIALLADEYAQLGKHTAASAPFLANIAFWREAGYFDNAGITKPLLHLWSLGVEEQFYIVWPAAALILWRLRLSRWGSIAVIATLSLTLNLMTVGPDSTAAFYSPLTRFWELLLGALLAQIEQDTHIKPSIWMRNAAATAGTCLLVGGLTFINESVPYPGALALLPVVGAVLIIFAGSKAFLNQSMLSHPVAISIGLISYPLYLWHWPLLSFAHIINSGVPDRSVRVALVILSFGLAAMTYKFVEKPIRFGIWKHRAVTFPLCASMALIGALGFLVFFNKGLPERPAALEGTRLASQFVGPLWPYTKNENCLTRYPFPEAAEYRWWFCMLEKDAPATILLTGGSFANQLYPGLAHNEALHDQNVLSIGTCAPLYIAPGTVNGPKTATPCSGLNWANQNRLIEEILDREPSIKTVIVDGLRSSAAPVDIDRIVLRLKQLERPGVQIVVFLPHYRRNLDVRGCFGRPFMPAKISCEIPKAEYDILITSNQAIADAIIQRLPNVLTFEQNAIFCKQGQCSNVANGLPLVRDVYHHISEYASELVAEEFVHWAVENYSDILASH